MDMMIDVTTQNQVIENNISKFIQYLRLKNLSQGTIEQYCLYYDLFNHSNLCQDEVNGFILQHKGSRVVRAFVNNYLAFLKRKDIDIPKITGRTKKRMAEVIDERSAEIMRYALYSLNEKYGLMFDVSLAGGLRRDELIKLTPSKFEWNTWSLDTSKPCRLHIIGKGDKERIVLMPPDLMQKIKVFLSKQIANNKVTMESYIWDCKEKAWWRILGETSKILLGKRIHPHQLRHLQAHRLYSTGRFDLIDLQNFLGHSSVATTELYLHPDKEKAIKKFEQFIMDEQKKDGI